MQMRSLLGSCLAVAFVAAAIVAGCATGETDNGGSDDGGTSPGDAACVAPQALCGTACVDLTSNHDNCGTCGNACSMSQVCVNSACAAGCMPNQALCGGPTSGDAGGGDDGGVDAAGDAASDASGDAAVDATVSDASSGGDAGTVAPYCTDLTSDPNNCGGCGKKCAQNHSCTMGSCVLNCPPNMKQCPNADACVGPGLCCATSDCSIIGETCPVPGGACTCPNGQKACQASSTCIGSSSCCTNMDCPIAGETCSGPGGSCSCPNGQKPCPTSNTCIPTANCCTNADCTVTGSTCGPTGACTCPNGDKACSATNSCIPLASCCTPADCPPPTHVNATSCTSGNCGIATCAPGWADANGVYSDGCECAETANGQTCAAATNLGSLGVGGSTTISGNLPVASEDNWFVVTFTGNTNPAYHPKITFSANPGNQFVFDATSNCNSPITCGVEGGFSTSRTTFETYWTGPVGNPVGNNGEVFIRVHRPSGGTTCDSFTLQISD